MTELHMWTYWRDKYGPAEALEEYFPELLKSDPILKAAHAQFIVGKQALESRMAELVQQAQDKEYDEQHG